MLSMHPTSATAVTRLALLPEPPRPVDTAAKIRRYRLARLRLDDRTPGERFAYLKHTHD